MNELVPATSNEAYIPVDVDKAAKEWEAYQNLCSLILDESDYQEYKTKLKTGEIINRQGKKKSAWQKLARAFNVNVEPVTKEIIRNKFNRVMEAEYTMRATLPNGRTVVVDGTCDRQEKGKGEASNHTIKSTAETRAFNRAVSAVIGAGETSAEEMDSGLLLDQGNENDIVIEANEDVTAEDVTVNEYVLLNYCKIIRNKLLEKRVRVTQQNMKGQLFMCLKAKEIDEFYKKPLIDFIFSHCPEELE